MTLIHPQAIIDPSAKIAEGVKIGPFSIIGAGVEIDQGNEICAHVVINGPTRIGRGNKIYQYASIGDAPQDKKYKGEPTRLEIGDHNVIREFVTINRGTIQDANVTRVGNHNWIMAYVHIAHDCQVGNNTVFSNSASLAGHAVVEDYAILSGFTLVHQFCRIGERAFTGMNSAISKDVPPYLIVSGHPAKPFGLNVEGLKRSGVSSATLSTLKKAYKIVYRSGNSLEEAIKTLRPLAENCPEIEVFVKFLTRSERGIVR